MVLFESEEIHSVEYIQTLRLAFLREMKHYFSEWKNNTDDDLTSILLLKELSSITWAIVQLEDELGLEKNETINM